MADKKKITEKTTARVGTKETAKIRFEDKIDAQIVEVKAGKVSAYKKAGSVYSADFKTIDDTIEEIKKECRRICKDDYTANNIYNIVQEALKKVRLSYT
jgi:hypothetical protein|tara:strand:+ start:737 stop:1033 length:297 start_codon:yes stop_codon:yes gene_type:complete